MTMNKNVSIAKNLSGRGGAGEVLSMKFLLSQ